MSVLSEEEWAPQACLEPKVLVKGKISVLGGKEGVGKSTVGLKVKGTGPLAGVGRNLSNRNVLGKF